MMDWQPITGPIRPLWRARGRTHHWVIVEASEGVPFLLYSYPGRESLRRERERGEYPTLDEAKSAAEGMEAAARARALGAGGSLTGIKHGSAATSPSRTPIFR